MEVLDDHTLAVTTANPFPEFLTNLTDRNTSIISPTAAEKYAPMDFGHQEPVGTGPFMFDKWVGTDQVEVVANPNYWGPLPQVDRLVFRIIPEAASLVAAVEAGEVDIATPINADDAIRLQDDPDLLVGQYDAFLTVMDGILMAVPPLDDVRVRHALNYMVDKEAITVGIFLGFAKPTETVLYPGLPYRVPQPPYEYNPEKARELLAEAGYPDGFTTELAYSPDFDKGKEVSEAIAAWAADVGITLELKPMESAVLSSYYREKDEVPGRRIFMMRKSAFGVDFNLTRLFTKASWDDDNRARFYDPEVERLLEEARYSFDEGLRARNYAEVQRIVWEAALEIFLYTYSPPYVTQTDVKGIWFKPDGAIMLAGVYRR
jgi:ABC-type transport system substrate-binding protein